MKPIYCVEIHPYLVGLPFIFSRFKLKEKYNHAMKQWTAVLSIAMLHALLRLLIQEETHQNVRFQSSKCVLKP